MQAVQSLIAGTMASARSRVGALWLRLISSARQDAAVNANRSLQGLCSGCGLGEPKEYGICDDCYYDDHPGF